jgi:hypothetical protein
MRKRPAIFWVGGLLVLACIGWQWARHSPRLRALWDLYEHTRYQDFIIEGQITQEDGQPLDFATIEVVTIRLKKAGTDSDRETQYVNLKDSHFRVERRGCSSVRLYFFRDGYQYQYMDFSKGGVHDNVKVVMRRESPKPAASRPSSATRPG